MKKIKRFFHTIFNWRTYCQHFDWKRQYDGSYVRQSTTVYDKKSSTLMRCTKCGRINI